MAAYLGQLRTGRNAAHCLVALNTVTALEPLTVGPLVTLFEQLRMCFFFWRRRKGGGRVRHVEGCMCACVHVCSAVETDLCEVPDLSPAVVSTGSDPGERGLILPSLVLLDAAARCANRPEVEAPARMRALLFHARLLLLRDSWDDAVRIMKRVRVCVPPRVTGVVCSRAARRCEGFWPSDTCSPLHGTCLCRDP